MVDIDRSGAANFVDSSRSVQAPTLYSSRRRGSPFADSPYFYASTPIPARLDVPWPRKPPEGRFTGTRPHRPSRWYCIRPSRRHDEQQDVQCSTRHSPPRLRDPAFTSAESAPEPGHFDNASASRVAPARSTGASRSTRGETTWSPGSVRLLVAAAADARRRSRLHLDRPAATCPDSASRPLPRRDHHPWRGLLGRHSCRGP